MLISAHATDATALAELGERLRRTRIRRELTQQDLAHEAGVSVDTVRRLEAGRAIGTDKLVRVLRATGLLGALDRAIPEAAPSPLERLALRGAERQRVRHSRTRRDADDQGWTWADDQAAGPANR